MQLRNGASDVPLVHQQSINTLTEQHLHTHILPHAAPTVRLSQTSPGKHGFKAILVLLRKYVARPQSFHRRNLTNRSPGRSKASFDSVLAQEEREAVADLLNYLENVRAPRRVAWLSPAHTDPSRFQRAETDFFSGEPLAALSTLVYSDNVDLQRSASLTFAEITERGMCHGRAFAEGTR